MYESLKMLSFGLGLQKGTAATVFTYWNVFFGAPSAHLLQKGLDWAFRACQHQAKLALHELALDLSANRPFQHFLDFAAY